MVSYIKGGIQAKGILKQDPEGNIWAQDSPSLCKGALLLEKNLVSSLFTLNFEYVKKQSNYLVLSKFFLA